MNIVLPFQYFLFTSLPNYILISLLFVSTLLSMGRACQLEMQYFATPSILKSGMVELILEWKEYHLFFYLVALPQNSKWHECSTIFTWEIICNATNVLHKVVSTQISSPWSSLHMEKISFLAIFIKRTWRRYFHYHHSD